MTAYAASHPDAAPLFTQVQRTAQNTTDAYIARDILATAHLIPLTGSTIDGLAETVRRPDSASVPSRLPSWTACSTRPDTLNASSPQLPGPARDEPNPEVPPHADLATTGIPAGCPAIDPLPPARVTIAPRGSYSSSTTYLVFAGCTATALEATVRITGATTGTLLATATARLTIIQPTPPAS